MTKIEDDAEEELASLRIENVVQHNILKRIKEEYRVAIKTVPSYLCGECRKEWIRRVEAQNTFIERMKGAGDV